MTTTTNYKFGDIVLVSFPFTNHIGNKRRPAVVISNETYHYQRPDIILMPITSQIKPNAYGETIVKHWKDSGLLKPSIIKPIIATMEIKLILSVLGQLSTSDQKSLKSLFEEIIG